MPTPPNIIDDPGCKQDLSGQQPELLARAAALFTSQHSESPWYVNLTEALQAKDATE